MATIESMTRKPWHSLFERLIDDWDERESPEWDVIEARLPSDAYTDPGRYKSEMSGLFRRFPLCLGDADQLAGPESVLAREIAGLPLLLARDAAGSIGVFLNARRIVPPASERNPAGSFLMSGLVDDASMAPAQRIPRREAFPLDIALASGVSPSRARHGRSGSLVGRQRSRHRASWRPDEDLVALGIGQHRSFVKAVVSRHRSDRIDAFVEFYHTASARLDRQFFADTTVADRVGRISACWS
jgi:hypothetical protein